MLNCNQFDQCGEEPFNHQQQCEPTLRTAISSQRSAPANTPEPKFSATVHNPLVTEESTLPPVRHVCIGGEKLMRKAHKEAGR